MEIALKRAYETPAGSDGYRVLIDRLWPRGVKKEKLQLNEWCKDIAPSAELREWFDHDPDKFKEFTARYEHELRNSTVPEELLERAKKANKLTFVYGAKDERINHAVVLKKYMEQNLR